MTGILMAVAGSGRVQVSTTFTFTGGQANTGGKVNTSYYGFNNLAAANFNGFTYGSGLSPTTFRGSTVNSISYSDGTYITGYYYVVVAGDVGQLVSELTVNGTLIGTSPTSTSYDSTNNLTQINWSVSTNYILISASNTVILRG